MSASEFVQVIAKAPKPPAALQRLEHIGRVVAANHREESEEHFRFKFGGAITNEHGKARWERTGKEARDKARKNIEALMHETYPVGIVADAHRIEALVAKYEPEAREREAALIEAAHERTRLLRERRLKKAPQSRSPSPDRRRSSKSPWKLLKTNVSTAALVREMARKGQGISGR